MLRKRIIFALIYSDGNFMQSRNFRLQKVGNLHWLEKNYKFQNIAFALDELIVLNASKGEKNMPEFASTISKLVNDVFIPIAAGGGIKTMEDAELLFKSGADKIVLNSLFIQDPSMVKELIKYYGSQSVVASIDCKLNESQYDIFINDGLIKIEFTLLDYIKYLEELGVGEIYLNSIDKDGTGFGYDQTLIEIVNKHTSLPLIIAGGAGNENHLAQGLKIENVSAVATANLFNFIGNGLPNARNQIIDANENIANWSRNNYITNLTKKINNNYVYKNQKMQNWRKY
jgi:cyclase